MSVVAYKRIGFTRQRESVGRADGDGGEFLVQMFFGTGVEDLRGKEFKIRPIVSVDQSIGFFENDDC